ncbi:MAG TPA: helix-turn-helix domain-containing protein [Candidatus Pullichristensenella stercorigallinarum]|uniref:Helix-turn-helix domain-containing protein n=1 Tax=Candidatus Pullichristensenella stercorigallinarum TaxID=2840909 RepID=A0A9D0ZJY7_9FIRM|nr:helix-turn-helix domain-containing protein [Candidatus Pullichristensenella stercorigallinarum]
MAVFRVQKTGNFTIMANHHLRDRTLSLKAKGLLSVLLSLPETWEYSVAGLAKILREGVGSISSGLKELEAAGYVRRRQRRDARGRMADTEYEVYEVPCLHASGAADGPVENLCKNGAVGPSGAAESPDVGGPPADEPATENPGAENPHAESAPQINTDSEKTEKSNKQESNHNPSHPLGEAGGQAPAGRPGAEEAGGLAEVGMVGLGDCECEGLADTGMAGAGGHGRGGLAEDGMVGLGDCERGGLADFGTAGAGGYEREVLEGFGAVLAGVGMRAAGAAQEVERACGGDGERLAEVGTADLVGRAGGDLAEAGAVGLDDCEYGGLTDFGAAGALAGGGARQVARMREAVREKLGYDCIVTDENRERLDGIVELVTETLCSRRASIRVAGEEYPAAVVKERLWRLNSLHIQYVFECLENTTSYIRNIRQYLLATLFNAPVTKDSYYDARARRDRALGFGRGWENG